MKKIKFITLVIVSILLISINLFSQSRPPLFDLLGVTCQYTNDNTSQEYIDSLVSSLSNLPCKTTTRTLFQLGDDPTTPNPSDYDYLVSRLHNVTRLMGGLMDSGEWDSDVFAKPDIINRLLVFLGNQTIKNDIDIWEVGNEVNGSWVYNQMPDSVMMILDTLLKVVKSQYTPKQQRRTAVTLYFYPSIDCVENVDNPENYMMLKWATDFVNNYPEVQNNLDYVFISYYRLDNIECSDVSEGWFWDSQIDSLKKLFPNSIIGFGEIGWPDGEGSTEPLTSEKVNIVNTYYQYAPPFYTPNYPWTHACFYWNYEDDCLNSVNKDYRNSQVWRALDSIMGMFCVSDNDKLFGHSNVTFNKQNNYNNKYSLNNNYPNPFNPYTKIGYTIPFAGHVSIIVYDLLGREVKVLVNEIKQAGSYTVDFNGSELSSGVYFYKLQSGEFSDIKRMILIK